MMLPSDQVSFHHVVVAVVFNDDAGEAGGSCDDHIPVVHARSTDPVAGRVVTEHHGVLGVWHDGLRRVNADPVVLEGVVITKAGGAVDLQAFVREAVDDEALDRAVIRAQHQTGRRTGRARTIELN